MLGSLTSFRRRLLTWYDRHRRDLPWRVTKQSTASAPIPPYHVLVSEFMLQQTQVATVIPYFHRFIERYPTFVALAAAPEQDVLRLWQGLGYYSRARNLLRCAHQLTSEYGGELPQDVELLRRLPGVGRYTAGAIASIAFGQRAAILDGNVMRVLCRLDRVERDPREPATAELLWLRAEQILPRKRVGDFNSALMELGALVCTPRAPSCLLCPVHEHCAAYAAGVQERIPAARKARPTPLEQRWIFCIRRGEQWLIEQRPASGRWAGMWQFVTVPAQGKSPTSATTLRRLPIAVSTPRLLGRISHGLTHRRYEFAVYDCEARDAEDAGGDRRWVTLSGLAAYPLPRPHVKVAAMLSDTY